MYIFIFLKGGWRRKFKISDKGNKVTVFKDKNLLRLSAYQIIHPRKRRYPLTTIKNAQGSPRLSYDVFQIINEGNKTYTTAYHTYIPMPTAASKKLRLRLIICKITLLLRWKTRLLLHLMVHKGRLPPHRATRTTTAAYLTHRTMTTAARKQDYNCDLSYTYED